MIDREKIYFDKFEEQLLRGNMLYVLQPDEKIVHCLSGDQRYYCPYWFLSNYGYLFSVYHRNIDILKPSIKWGGRNKNNENYECPEYVKHYDPNWKVQVNKGYRPQYYFYKNSFNSGKQVKMHELMAHYFPDKSIVENNTDIPDYKLVSQLLSKEDVEEIHHKTEKDWNTSPQTMNRASNLQGLPHNTHVYITTEGNGIKKDFREKMKQGEENVAHRYILPTTIEDFLFGGVFGKENSQIPVLYMVQDSAGKVTHRELKFINNVEKM